MKTNTLILTIVLLFFSKIGHSQDIDSMIVKFLTDFQSNEYYIEIDCRPNGLKTVLLIMYKKPSRPFVQMSILLKNKIVKGIGFYFDTGNEYYYYGFERVGLFHRKQAFAFKKSDEKQIYEFKKSKKRREEITL